MHHIHSQHTLLQIRIKQKVLPVALLGDLCVDIVWTNGPLYSTDTSLTSDHLVSTWLRGHCQIGHFLAYATKHGKNVVHRVLSLNLGHVH